MSTKGTIGYYDGKRVEYINAYYDADLYADGVILQLCYTEPEKVKRLMQLHEITELHNLPAAPIAVDNAAMEDKLYEMTSQHTLTSYTHSRMGAKALKKVRLGTYAGNWTIDSHNDVAFKYLYFADMQQWYVIGRGFRHKQWLLQRLLTEEEYLQQFCVAEGYSYSYSGIKQTYDFHVRQLNNKPDIVDAMNRLIEMDDFLGKAKYRVLHTADGTAYELWQGDTPQYVGSIYAVLLEYIKQTTDLRKG